MPSPSRPSRPLIVRLRNWVGDVVLGLPALRRLADAGYALQLVGKPWTADLLASTGWPVATLPKTALERIGQMRALRAAAAAADPGFGGRINAVCLPYSFGSALEFRLAGLRAIGHAWEGRGWLLSQRVPRPPGQHELEVYWRLADAVLGADAPLPAAIGLVPSAAQRAEARSLLAGRGIGPGFIAICPFAGGTYSGEDKSWPGFAEFAARALPDLGRPVLVCPGPGEEALARASFGGATLLPGVGLGTYAALLEGAALMISNDTGPGHLAAAVGTPLLSVLGPTEPSQWGAWGPGVQVVRRRPGWPEVDEVAAAARALLSGAPVSTAPALRPLR